MNTLLKANRAEEDIIVNGDFDAVVNQFSKKPNTTVTDCRRDPEQKNKTVWVNGINMSTIVHPDNRHKFDK